MTRPSYGSRKSGVSSFWHLNSSPLAAILPRPSLEFKLDLEPSCHTLIVASILLPTDTGKCTLLCCRSRYSRYVMALFKAESQNRSI